MRANRLHALHAHGLRLARIRRKLLDRLGDDDTEAARDAIEAAYDAACDQAYDSWVSGDYDRDEEE